MAAAQRLFPLKGHTVCAQICSGTAFVGADKDVIQRTVVFASAVVRAVMNGTFDALVCMAVHSISSLTDLRG